MTRVARVALFVAAVAVGFAAGRQSSQRYPQRTPGVDPADSDFRFRVRVTSWGGGNFPAHCPPVRYELVPYRIVLDGKRVFDTLDGQNKTGDIWQIDLANDRLRIFAERRQSDD